MTPLLKVEQPPRLQALLKAITTRIKAIIHDTGSLDPEVRHESQQQIVDAILKQSEYLVEVINNTNADVRKCSVFCLVEIYSVLSTFGVSQ